MENMELELEIEKSVDDLFEEIKKNKNESNAEFRERIRKLKGHKTTVLSVVVQKGGVGKSTITSNICYKLAQKGFKVLAIDSDSQASLTGLLNVFGESIDDKVEGLADVYEEFMADPLNFDPEIIDEYIIKPTYQKIKMKKDENGKMVPTPIDIPFGFDLLAGDLYLSDVEVAMRVYQNSGSILGHIIKAIIERYDYDYIIFDCPPGLGMLAYNAIGCSTDGIIIPINLEIMTLRGAKNIIKMLAKIQKGLQKAHVVHHGILGIVMNEYQVRSRLQKTFKGELNMWWPIKKFNSIIPSRSACNDAHYEGILFSMKSKDASQVFDSLVDEIIVENIIRSKETESMIITEFGEEYKRLCETRKLEENQTEQEAE